MVSTTLGSIGAGASFFSPQLPRNRVPKPSAERVDGGRLSLGFSGCEAGGGVATASARPESPFRAASSLRPEELDDSSAVTLVPLPQPSSALSAPLLASRGMAATGSGDNGLSMAGASLAMLAAGRGDGADSVVWGAVGTAGNGGVEPGLSSLLVNRNDSRPAAVPERGDGTGFSGSVDFWSAGAPLRFR